MALRGTPCSLTAPVNSYFLGQNLGKTWHLLRLFFGFTFGNSQLNSQDGGGGEI